MVELGCLASHSQLYVAFFIPKSQGLTVLFNQTAVQSRVKQIDSRIIRVGRVDL